jgi:predicted flavoprotein YhiN
LKAIDRNFQLHKIPNQFCIGEMLNWDAPTGGYLIQACASTGVYLSNYLNEID